MNAAVLAAGREREAYDKDGGRMKTGTKTKWRGWRERCRCRGCIREDEWGPNGMDGNIRPRRLGFDSGPAPRCAPLFWASAAGRKVEKRSRGKAGGRQAERRCVQVHWSEGFNPT